MKKIKTYEKGTAKAVVYHDPEWEEFRVKHFTKGKHLSVADYHTDDKKDAHDTAKKWIREENLFETDQIKKYRKAQDNLHKDESLTAWEAAKKSGVRSGKLIQRLQAYATTRDNAMMSAMDSDPAAESSAGSVQKNSFDPLQEKTNAYAEWISNNRNGYGIYAGKFDEAQYSKSAVEKQMDKDGVPKKARKLTHSLLKGRQKTDEPVKKERFDHRAFVNSLRNINEGARVDPEAEKKAVASFKQPELKGRAYSGTGQDQNFTGANSWTIVHKHGWGENEHKILGSANFLSAAQSQAKKFGNDVVVAKGDHPIFASKKVKEETEVDEARNWERWLRHKEIRQNIADKAKKRSIKKGAEAKAYYDSHSIAYDRSMKGWKNNDRKGAEAAGDVMKDISKKSNRAARAAGRARDHHQRNDSSFITYKWTKDGRDAQAKYMTGGKKRSR